MLFFAIRMIRTCYAWIRTRYAIFTEDTVHLRTFTDIYGLQRKIGKDRDFGGLPISWNQVSSCVKRCQVVYTGVCNPDILLFYYYYFIKTSINGEKRAEAGEVIFIVFLTLDGDCSLVHLLLTWRWIVDSWNCWTWRCNWRRPTCDWLCWWTATCSCSRTIRSCSCSGSCSENIQTIFM